MLYLSINSFITLFFILLIILLNNQFYKLLNIDIYTIYLILISFGYDPLSVLLAFSPGGQSEMNILALSIGADMSFISPHHMFRVFLVIIVAGI